VGSIAEIEAEQAERERLKRQQEATEAARREASEAQARNARGEAERKYQLAVSEQERIARERGYKTLTFEDFTLDRKELALSNAKIAIKGVYTKRGESEMLFPSVIALLMARETFNTNTGIGLLTEDAVRSIRKYLLACQTNLLVAAQGCPVTVLGRATMCERTSLVSATSIPCIAVDDGWHIAPP
jgi:hypothetical protein